MFKRTLFDETHEAFRDMARRFVARDITPHHTAWEDEGRVSREAWLKAGEAGLLCASVPEAYGGPGADFLFSSIFLEEMARAGATGPGFWLHTDIVTPYILNYGTEALKQEWLPRMAKGQAIASLGMTEPGSGSDVQGIQTRAVRHGDDYVINGQKVFITNGGTCDILVLACKTDPGAGAKGMSLIAVPTDTPGFSRHVLKKIGGHAQDTGALFFDDVRVPAGNLLGSEGQGFSYLMQELAQERLVTCIRCCAILEGAFDWTVDYITDRNAFGRRIADFQNTRFKMAEMKAEVVKMRVFVDRCIEMHLAGDLDAADAAIAKLYTSETLSDCLDTMMQFFGGYGYMADYPIGKAWIEARAGRVAGGSSEIMREIIGRDVLGKPPRPSPSQ